MAVGEYENSRGVGFALAEAWNGKKWVSEPTPNPKGASSSSLSGVSCTAATACTAIGSYANSAGDTATLAEAWNGKKWAIEPTPNPKGANFGFSTNHLLGLSAVSCSSAKACTAVGSYTNSAFVGFTLAEAWNGKKWTIEPTPNPNGTNFSMNYDGYHEYLGLSGVSCTSANACTAVGNYETQNRRPVVVSYDSVWTLAEAWNGKKWATEPTPRTATDGSLSEVSCTSSTACTAVGSYNNSVPVTLAEAWNGKTWAIEPTPNPTGSQLGNDLLLSGVSCTSANACKAVGSYSTSSVEYLKELIRPLAEARN
jgi:hypothetical protein